MTYYLYPVSVFVNRVKDKALGAKVLDSITPGQQFIKIVKDELVDFLSSNDIDLNINKSRITELKKNFDENNQFTNKELNRSKIKYTNKAHDLKRCNIFIITVPTPVLNSKQPDLRPLKSSSKLVGRFLKKGSIVIYESTVFPGCTEEICVPILSKISGLKYNKDYFCGYSPERINFGDKKHTLTNIKKITSDGTTKI